MLKNAHMQSSTFSQTFSQKPWLLHPVLPKTPSDPKAPRPRFLNCAGGTELLTESCSVALTGSGCGFSEARVAMKVIRQAKRSEKQLAATVVDTGCTVVKLCDYSQVTELPARFHLELRPLSQVSTFLIS